ncbi:unnamed protein product [Brugia timori]|uniref:Uncharacterized protein n=1 Tax=Brugia timori TaxID=42155 RepID=A0A0R3QZJ2_9BILA|nr:unnamed protein product [Brugia timori]
MDGTLGELRGRQWCSGIIAPSHGADPGSTPGWRRWALPVFDACLQLYQGLLQVAIVTEGHISGVGGAYPFLIRSLSFHRALKT